MAGNDLLSRYREKKNKVTTSASTNTGDDLLKKYRSYKTTDTSGVDQKYVESFMNDANTFLSSAKTDYEGLDGNNASSTYTRYNERWHDLSKRAEAVDAWLYQKRNSFDSDTYNTLRKSVADFRSGGTSIMDEFKGASEYYASDEYKNALSAQKQREEMLAYDMVAGEAALKDLETKYNEAREIQYAINKRIRALKGGSGMASIPDEKLEKDSELAQLREQLAQYGDVSALHDELRSKKQYHTLAGREQEAASLASVVDNEDFQQNSKYVKAQNSLISSDTFHGYINEEAIRDALDERYTAKSDVLSTVKATNYDEMTKDEVAIYNYYYNTEGQKKAREYLNSIQETLNTRAALRRFEGMEDKEFLEMLFGVEAGLDQFHTGIANLLFSGEDYIPAAEAQILSGMVREDLADNGFTLPDWLGGSSIAQIGYDAITTTSNMLPSIMISLVPYVGQAAGAVTLGASAAGHAKADMLNLGYTKEQANTYGLMVGASEAGLQYLLGGISKLGGKAPQGLTKLALSKVDNAFARVAITLGANMGAEGLEEGLQTVIEPWLKSLVTGVDFEAPDIDEVLYSSLLGAITSLIMEGGTTVASEVGVRNAGANLKASGAENVTALANLGKGFSEGTAANRLGNKVNENSSAYMIGRLLTEAGGSLTEQNIADISAKLQEGGMSAQAATDTAKWLYQSVEGNYFADSQLKTLQSVRQRNAEYDALYNLANDMSRGKKATKASTQQAETTPTTENAPVKENATQGKFEASETGKTTHNGSEVKVESVASVKNGNVMLKLNDGNVVNANDVEFSTDEEARLYEAVRDEKMDADTANDFVSAYRAAANVLSHPQSVMDYRAGFVEAQTYGRLGIPFEALARDGQYTSGLVGKQAQIAYNRGKVIGINNANAAQNAPKKLSAKKITYKEEIHVSNIKKSKVYKSLSDTQKAGIDGMLFLYKALGIDVYFFESPTDKNGKRKGENGYFNPKDGSVHIDLYAGIDGRGLILFTGSHELTHYIRAKLPAKFKIFADALLKQYEANGNSIAERIATKKYFLVKKGRTKGLTEDEINDLAYEEVIADACEAMLANGEAFVQISEEIKAKDKGLWEAIKSFFANLVARIKGEYANLEPDSIVGKKVAEMLETATELQRMWVEMLVEASTQEQFSTDGIRGNADGAVAKSEVTEALVDSTADDGVLLSTRTEYEALPKQSMSLSTGAGTILHSIEGLKPTLVKGITEKSINGFTGRAVREYAMGISGFTKKQIGEVNKFMDAMADFMKEAGVTYRFIGLQDVENATLHYTYDTEGRIKSVVLSAMVKNGDYPVNFDLSSICKKREAMSALIRKLAKRGSLDNGTVKLTPSNIFKINTALKDAGYETACLGCFVESKRYNSLEWAKKFCDKWNAAVKKVNKNATYFGYGTDTFSEDSFTLEQAIKIDDAANKYIKATKTERLANALAKYKAKEQAGQPLVAGKVMKVDGKELNTFSKAARDRLMKSDTISEELKTKYLTCDVSTLTLDDVEFLLENGVLPGASLSNKQAVTELVKSGEAYQHLLRPSDLLTDRGISKLEALPNFHGVLYGHYGSGTPKLMQGYTPYNSEIALLPANKNNEQTLAEYLYTIAGVRMQSFSDFQIQNIYDYLQMVADLAARKVPAHAYTKEISFAKLLGMTGIKVNLSVMFDIDPMVDEAHAGLTKLNQLVHKGEYAKVVLEDAQGKWVYNIGDYQTQRMFEAAYPDEAKRFLQSIGFADAVRLQSSTGYSANCGIIGVGYSDLGIFAMLDDNRIRYIIPYHASSLPADIKVATRIEFGTDYTPYQNNMKIVEIVDSNGNKVKWTIKEAYKRLGSGQAVINELNDKVKNEGWVVTTKKAQTGHGTYGLYEDLQETNDPRQTASNFMDWCIGNSTLPLFYQFASHENYYKMLYDYNVYDCVTEEYAPQQAVTNTYPTMVDGEVKAGTVTDGGFDAEYLQGTINKQMAFMNQYGENLDSDLEKLADNMEEGKYSLHNGFMFSERESYAPTFYSHMGKVIDDIKLEKMGSASILNHLKNRGVKAEEIKWSGIEAFLEGKKSVTKAELQEFVAGSQLVIEEEIEGVGESIHLEPLSATIYGESNSVRVMRDNQVVDTMFWDEESELYESDALGESFVDTDEILDYYTNKGTTRWSEYKLDGGTNYRELVFKMPNSSYSNRAMKAHWGQDAQGVLAHARIQDMTTAEGKRMLFIEEIQSDWHNAGQKYGYKDNVPSFTEDVQMNIAITKKILDAYRSEGMPVENGQILPYISGKEKGFYVRSEKGTSWARPREELILSPEEIKYMNDKRAYVTEQENPSAPDAPFRTTYHEYVLKRLLRMAAEEGYDAIGWTPAGIQSDRWSDEYAEGYRIEYDQEIPKFLRKYGKKWGAKVGTSTVSNTEVWSMDIPDSMTESVLYEGQVMYSDRVTDKETLDFLENQEHITTYKSFVEIDGKLYSPMATKVKGGDGKYRLTNPSELGAWQQAEEKPDSIPKFHKSGYGYYVLKKDDGGTVTAAYNPYEHSSNLVLNDQFESAYQRPNLVTVECVIPKSEMTSGYKAKFAKDSVGYLDWKSGTVAGKLKGNKRKVYLSRWLKPVRILSDAEVASMYKDILGSDISVPFNVVTPQLRTELERVGVKIDYEGSPGYQYRQSKKTTDDGTKFSDRDPDSVSNRSLLANALESVAQNDVERNKLAEYKGKVALIESEQAKLAETKAKIKELSFAKGRRDTETIKQLQFEANQIANRINTYDRQLLNLESTKALKGVLEREKQMAYKKAEKKGKEALAKQREKAADTQRELLTRYQESRKKGVEGRRKTEMRHKIKDVVNELNQYLLKGTKDKHVPIELQKAVAEALDAVNMDTVGAEERIAKKRAEMLSAKSPEAIEKLAKEIEHIREMGGNMAQKISRLKTSYDSIINSDDPLIANSHDDVISSTIDKVIEVVGETPLRDMSLYQLEAVHDMYRMILASVRSANKAFKAEKGKEISVLANTVIADLDGKKRNPLNPADTNFAWNNLKPVYAFERIGSNTFTKLFNAVRAGEDVWAVDMSEAQAFREEQYQKHKVDSWDFEKKYPFETKNGVQFELTLGEMMSVYAFAKDPHSKGHLIGEGFVFDPKKEVVENVKGKINVKVNLEDATSYNLSEEIVTDIINKLGPEKTAFVDAMQDYLSFTMGEKGNEVSLELYEIKLFKNKNYFPLKVAPQYMAVAKEKAQGDVKIKNKGFTKDRKEGAKNPIVLSSFMDVWADHVTEMSMYHAFTLPLEDFYRVFNYKTPRMEGYAPMSVNASIENAYGKAATSYIEQLLKDLNGGARVDPTVGVINKMTGLFKKSAVFASASVVVQQPSAIARATALVDAKYFVGKPAKGKHKELWEEVKKYAPVAIIKEMGYFDTGMGKSSAEWLKGEKTWKDKVDDIASKAPALADEYAWCAIWNAVKRETLHTHKNIRPNSEEFLKAVGERFTEVITKTQVYDSVMARSGNMRSKDTGMKMATAFMAEPTTSLNMIGDALVQAKRGNKKYARKTIGAVVASMILNSILVSIVYAGRDDDEDKTYAEKYVGTLTEELLDSFNPLTLIPFVKDIVSIVQGYDVERSDMAVITDLIKAWRNLGNDNRTVYRKVEDFAGAIASIFGLPVKNIMRDVRGVYNTVNSFINGEKTTGAGIGTAITEAVTGKEKSNGQQLYDAMVKGDSKQIERITGRFKDQSAINSAIRSALRENDPRINEAAMAAIENNDAKRKSLTMEIEREKNFSSTIVRGAINNEIQYIKNKVNEAKRAKGTDKYDDIVQKLLDKYPQRFVDKILK